MRLKVDYTGFTTTNPQKFGARFVNRVANPSSLLKFTSKAKKRAEGESSKKKREGKDVGEDDDEGGAEDDQAQIKDLVGDFLTGSTKEQLRLLPQSVMDAAVFERFVQYQEKDAISTQVESWLTTTQKVLQSQLGQFDVGQSRKDQESTIEQMLKERTEATDEEAAKAAAAKQRSTASASSTAGSKRGGGAAPSSSRGRAGAVADNDDDDFGMDDDLDGAPAAAPRRGGGSSPMGFDDDDDEAEDYAPSKAKAAPKGKAAASKAAAGGRAGRAAGGRAAGGRAAGGRGRAGRGGGRQTTLNIGGGKARKSSGSPISIDSDDEVRAPRLPTRHSSLGSSPYWAASAATASASHEPRAPFPWLLSCVLRRPGLLDLSLLTAPHARHPPRSRHLPRRRNSTSP